MEERHLLSTACASFRRFSEGLDICGWNCVSNFRADCWIGCGAVRYCRFSTGDFVEPITIWDEDRLLAFNVAAGPPSLREISPWQISPPHLERNYMRALHGQFRLVALDKDHTLLEGTTWYQNYFWPQVYWREWSDAIVHRIHMRVLEHVKAQAERQVTGTVTH
jgi:hypothetical protein